MANYIFDIDDRDPGSGLRPCHLIGPFASFDALRDWADTHDFTVLQPYWQAVTLPSGTSGTLPIYTPERAERELSVDPVELEPEEERKTPLRAEERARLAWGTDPGALV